MALINVNSFPVNHDKGNGGSGGKTIIINNNSSNFENLNVKSINASLGNIDYLKVKSITANDGLIGYLQSSEGEINTLKGDLINYNRGYIGTLTTDEINAKKITVDDLDALKAWIKQLNSDEITTEYLTVTKQTQFFELIIDKIRSVGGQLILTPASCTVDYVWGIDNHSSSSDIRLEPTPENLQNIDEFEIFWRTIDADGRTIKNDWVVNDQAICQSFNNAHTGTNYNIANKYYWRLVKQVGWSSSIQDVYVNFSTGAILTNTSSNVQKTYSNEYDIAFYPTITSDGTTEAENDILWTVEAMYSDVTPAPVTWTTSHTYDNGKSFDGVMKSSSKTLGISIKPSNANTILYPTSKLVLKILQKTDDNTSAMYRLPEHMNVNVYFEDDTCMAFNDIELTPYNASDPTQYGTIVLDLSASTQPISEITIISTEDNEWHLCHCIRLSNKSNEKDADLTGYANIPTKDDNIVQLGYRGTDDNARQSAIIIAAYHTPDTGITPPSYAQYIGINDFNLASHRQSYFDANGAKFLGDITLANLGDTPLRQAFLKIAYEGDPIIGTYAEDGTRTISPSTFNVKVFYIDANGNTTEGYETPTGYKVQIDFIYNNGTQYQRVEKLAGQSTENISVVNYVDDNNVRYYIEQVDLKLMWYDTNDAGEIDRISIPYDNQKYWKTDSYFLEPIKEIAYANILNAFTDSSTTANDQNVNLYVDFDYKIGHYKQGVLSYEKFKHGNTENSGISINVNVYYQSTGTGNPITVINNNNITWTYTNTDYDATFEDTNYLKTLWPQNSEYWDYMTCYKSHRDKLPVYFEIQLKKGNDVIDGRSVFVAIQSGAIWKLTNNAIISAVASSKGYTDGVAGELQNDISLVEQKADSITNEVHSDYATKSELGTTAESLESIIKQTAGMIRSEVKREYATTDDHLTSSNSTEMWVQMEDNETYDEDTFYKINITPSTANYGQKHKFVIQVERECSNNESYWGNPDYSTGNGTSKGFELMLNYSFITASDGSWTSGNLYVNEYSLMYTDNTDKGGLVIGDIGRVNTSGSEKFNIYMRGGSRYRVRVSETMTIAIDASTTESTITKEPEIYHPTMSRIEQTAERISLEVIDQYDGVTGEELKRTGIDIESGLITLDSENTVFTGNIIMSNPNEGLIIKDSNGNARINVLNNSLGNLSDFDFGIDNLLTKLEFQTYSSTSSTVTHTFEAQTLGTLSTGQQLKLKNMEIVGYWTDYDYTTQSITSATYSYVLKCGNTTITTQSGTATQSSLSHLRFVLPDYNNSSVPNSGTYTITLTVTFNLSSSQVNKGTFKFFNQIGVYSVSPNINRIGLDGAVFASGPEKYNWFGSDYTQIRNGRSILRLKDNVIERNCYQTDGTYTDSHFGDISSTMPYIIIDGLSYTATADDCIIFFRYAGTDNTSARSLMLPQPGACPGKVYFIKNAVGYTSPLGGNYISTDCNVTTVGTNGLIWHADGHTETTINIKGESAIFISCGLWWISFNCD